MKSFFRFPVLVAAAGFFLSSCSEENGAEKLLITGSSTVAPVVADAAIAFEKENPGTRIDVQTGGSSRGIADARSGLADIGMASRALKKDESDLKAHTVAVDGVCLIVHRDNPISGLSLDQVLKLYKKEARDWSELGGSDGEIVVVNKADGRATLEVFLDYLGLDSSDVKPDVIVGENQQAIKTVAGNPLAIGYVSIGAAASEASAGAPIKLISSDGVKATTENVANGSFPITRPLNLVTKGELSPLQIRFVEYLTSDAVKPVIQSHLYVSKAP